MGDYSISCGMSGLSMHNADVVLFPLVPNKYEAPEGKFSFAQHIIVSNQGATALFEPWALPIFGYLGTYGILEKIDEDYNAKSLETYLNQPILEIAENMCYPCYDLKHNDCPNTKFPKYHTAMLVHRKVWDKFSEPGFDEWGRRIELKDYNGVPRKHTWDRTILNWKQRKEHDKQLLEHLKQTGADEETIELFSSTSYYDLQHILSFGARRDVEAVLDIYPDAMDNEEFYDRMTELHNFRWNMMACNRLFMPTFNGYQYGNFYMTRELAQLTSQLAQEKIDAYEKWRDG